MTGTAWQAARASAEPPGAPGLGPAGAKPPGSGFGTSSKRPTEGSAQGGTVSCHLEELLPCVRPGKIRPRCSEQAHQTGWGGPEAPEQSLARNFQRVFQAHSAGLPQAAGQMLGSCEGPLAEGGLGHSSGRLTTTTSKWRCPETYQEGAPPRSAAPKQLVGRSYRTSVTPASDTNSCVALGQSLSLSEPQRP